MEEKVEVRKYSKLAYVLCAFFFGGLGIHSFIAGKVIQGIIFIVFTILALILSVIGLGFIIFGIESFIIFIQIIMALCKKSDEFGRIS